MIKLIKLYLFSAFSLSCFGANIYTNNIFSIKTPNVKENTDGILCSFYIQPNGGKFASNVLVQVQESNMTAEEFYDKQRSDCKSMNFKTIKTNLGNNSAVIEYTGQFGGNYLHWYQRILKSENKFFIITATSLDSDWKKDKTELLNSVDSFNLNNIVK